MKYLAFNRFTDIIPRLKPGDEVLLIYECNKDTIPVDDLKNLSPDVFSHITFYPTDGGETEKAMVVGAILTTLAPGESLTITDASLTLPAGLTEGKKITLGLPSISKKTTKKKTQKKPGEKTETASQKIVAKKSVPSSFTKESVKAQLATLEAANRLDLDILYLRFLHSVLAAENEQEWLQSLAVDYTEADLAKLEPFAGYYQELRILAEKEEEN